MIAISRTGRLLRRLVRLSCRRPLVTTSLSIILAVAGIAYTLHALSFKTSGRDLLPRDAGYVVRYNQYARDFGELEDSVIVMGAPASRRARGTPPPSWGRRRWGGQGPTRRAWFRSCAPPRSSSPG